MGRWLLKTEPEDWSWEDQCARGEAGESWTGVRNAAARLRLKDMGKGDLAFFYHTGKEKRIVGIVEVIRTAYPDPTDPDGQWVAVDVIAREALPRPVTLEAIRTDPELADMVLVRQSRLSVQPVTTEEWARVIALSES